MRANIGNSWDREVINVQVSGGGPEPPTYRILRLLLCGALILAILSIILDVTIFSNENLLERAWETGERLLFMIAGGILGRRWLNNSQI